VEVRRIRVSETESRLQYEEATVGAAGVLAPARLEIEAMSNGSEADNLRRAAEAAAITAVKGVPAQFAELGVEPQGAAAAEAIRLVLLGEKLGIKENRGLAAEILKKAGFSTEDVDTMIQELEEEVRSAA
jgi:hypothetical protein